MQKHFTAIVSNVLSMEHSSGQSHIYNFFVLGYYWAVQLRDFQCTLVHNGKNNIVQFLPVKNMEYRYNGLLITDWSNEPGKGIVKS